MAKVGRGIKNLTIAGLVQEGIWQAGKGLYDFNLFGIKDAFSGKGGSTSSWYPETKKEKEEREAREGRVVKDGTQRFLGNID